MEKSRTEYLEALIEELTHKYEEQENQSSYLQYVTLSNIYKNRARIHLTNGHISQAYDYAYKSVEESYTYFKKVLDEDAEKGNVISQTKDSLIRRITFAFSILLGIEKLWQKPVITPLLIEEILHVSNLIDKRYFNVEEIENIAQVSSLECGSLFTVELTRSNNYAEFIKNQKNFFSLDNETYYGFLSIIYSTLAQSYIKNPYIKTNADKIAEYSGLAAEAEKEKGDIANYYKFLSDKLLYEIYQTEESQEFKAKREDLSISLNNYLEANNHSHSALKKQSLDNAYALIHGLSLNLNLEEKIQSTKMIIDLFQEVNSRKHQLYRVYIEFLGLCKIVMNIKRVDGFEKFQVKQSINPENAFQSNKRNNTEYIRRYFPDVITAFKRTNELKSFLNNLIEVEDDSKIQDKTLKNTLILFKDGYINKDISLHILKKRTPVILGEVKAPKPLTMSVIEEDEDFSGSEKGGHYKNIKNGETKLVEFKSSLTWDVENERGSQEVLLSAMKAIAGFLNTEGGILYIGIQDDGSVLGLENEYKQIKSPHPKVRDTFIIKLTDKISKHLEQHTNSSVSAYIETLNNKDVCIVEVEKASKPTYLEGKFYYRASASTELLEGKQLGDYLIKRFYNKQ